ncbi:MAG: uracil-DNA glycosylase [Myxococcaceae bacterium]|nr:uracil-DNA glycosylase [Myxococcaceae bacterium]
MTTLAGLQKKIVTCRLCPRLVAWREEVATVKRAAYRDQTYWGRPVPGFGDPKAKLVIVGLAPGAHGANRTGRMFTGDRSGEFLYAGLHRAGFASQPQSTSRDDGLTLTGAFITAPVRCAPPDNLPTPGEIATCRPYLTRELELLKPTVYLALGAIAWAAILEHLDWPRPRPKFAHGAVVDDRIVGCYHVSQQNTQTGRLTPAMFDAVMGTVKRLVANED